MHEPKKAVVMAMIMKKGVKLKGIQPEILAIIPIVEDAYKRRNYPLVVTSANDGDHMEGSRHYTGEAIDTRIRHVQTEGEINSIFWEIREEIGPEFDVVLEEDHIHIELDPGK